MSLHNELNKLFQTQDKTKNQFWIVSQVGSGATAGKVKLKRSATSTETRWLPVRSGLTLVANDKVLLQGNDINTSVVLEKI